MSSQRNRWIEGLIIATLVCWPGFSACADDAPLRAPAGYYQPAQQKNTSHFNCPPSPPPFTGKLEFLSKYDGDGPSKDTINKVAEQRYKQATASIRDYEKGLVKLADTIVKKGKSEAPLQCMVIWYKTWIAAGALQDTHANSIGKAVRKWALAAASSAWLRVKLAEPASYKQMSPDDKATIENWLKSLALQVQQDYSHRGADKANNHDYWAAWAVMATAVVINDKALFAWSADVYQLAMSQIDAEGYLPNELARQSRALGYHNFALQPLVMLHVFLAANHHPAAEFRKREFLQLAEHVLQGISNPALFALKTGHQQITDNLPSSNAMAWIEPFNTAFPEAGAAPWISKFRPFSSTRMGGNMTIIFADKRVTTHSGK